MTSNPATVTIDQGLTVNHETSIDPFAPERLYPHIKRSCSRVDTLAERWLAGQNDLSRYPAG